MNWAIIGAGTIAKKFASTVNAMEGESLIAVGSRTIEKAEAFREEYSIKRAYSSYEEAVKDEEVDAVYIATPNSMHFDNAMMCLENGKHVLCEKPFTINADEAIALYEFADAKGLFIMEAFWIRLLPLYEKLLEILDSGVLGRIVHIRSEYGFVAKGARKDRKFDSSLGGGALLDIGIYNLGFIHMLTDEMPETFSSEVNINEYGTDDYSVIQYKYSDGKTASAVTSIGINIPRHAAILCEKGQIYIDDFQHADSMRIIREDGEEYVVDMPFEINGFEYQIREVSKCVANGETHSSIYTPDRSIAVIAQMDQIRASWGMKFSFEG